VSERLGSWARDAGPATVLVGTWLLFIAGVYGTRPEYSLWQVAAGLALSVALAAGLRSGEGVAPTWQVLAGVVLAWSLAQLALTGFQSVLPPDRERAVVLLVSTALLCTVLLVWRGLGGLAVGIAGVTLVAVGAEIVHAGPVAIDVYHFSNQASEHVLTRNMYETRWTGLRLDDPVVLREGFPYLPMSAVLLAPFRWLAGDVRWGLLACMVLAGWLVRAASHGRGRDPRVGDLLAVLALLMPTTVVMVENAWNEPLVLVLLLGSLLAFERGRALPAVVLLALALATKQHVLLLLPVLALWRPAGPRRTLSALGVTAALTLPWVLASPSAFWRSVVGTHLDVSARTDASTLHVWALRQGWESGLTAAAVVALAVAIAYAAWQVRVRDDLPAAALACALVLLVASLVNKQAFTNQWWLVAALALVGFAGRDLAAPTPVSDPRSPGTRSARRPRSRPARTRRSGRPSASGAAQVS
jgi:hypothetical protein